MAKGDDKKTYKQELEEFIKRNTEASKSLKDFNEQSSTAFHIAAEAVRLYASTLKDTVDSTQELNERLKDSSGDYEKNIEKIREGLGLSKQSLSQFTDEIKKQGKSQEEAAKAAGFKKTGSGQDGKNNVYEQIAKSSKAAKIGLVALHGAVKLLSSAFKLISFTISGVIDVISSGIKLVASLATGIFDFVMDLWEGLFDMSKQMMQQSADYARAIEEVRDKFGDVSQGVGKAVVNMGNQMFAGTTAGLSGFALFEDKADALRKMSEMASAGGAAFELLIDQFKGQNLNALYAFKQGLGLTNEEFAGLARNAIVTGRPLKEITLEIQKYARGLSKEFGGSAQAFKSFSRDIAKARMDVKHFANVATKDLAKATAYARSLGLELEKIVGIMDAFDTFDAAAENVAKLSQAFGVNLDVMELMSAKTPDEQIDMLKKSFAAAGKSIESMNRQELSYLATTLKLDEATTQQLLSSKNQGASMDRVKKSTQSLEQQMLSMGSAMKDLMKEIPRVIREFQSESKGFFSAFIEGIGIGIVRSGPFRDMLKDIGKAIIQVRNAGIRLGQAFVKYFPGIQKMMDSLGNIMPKIGDLFDRWSNTVVKFFQNLKSGKPVVEGLIDSLVGDTKGFFKDIGKDGDDFLNGLSETMSAVGQILKEVFIKIVNTLADVISGGLNALADALEGKNNPLENLGMPKINTKKISDAFAPIGEALTNAFTKVKPALVRVLTDIWNIATDALSEKLVEIFEDPRVIGALTALAAILGGPIGAVAAELAAVYAYSKSAGAQIADMSERGRKDIDTQIGSDVLKELDAAKGGDPKELAKKAREAASKVDLEALRSKLGISESGEVSAKKPGDEFGLTPSDLKAMYMQYIGDYGMVFEEEDQQKIIDYLNKSYGDAVKNKSDLEKIAEGYEKKLAESKPAFSAVPTEAPFSIANLPKANDYMNLAVDQQAEVEKEQKRIQKEQAEMAEELGVTTMDNVESRIKKMKEIGEKIMGGEKQFNEQVAKFRESLKKYDFVIMDKPTSDKFAEGIAGAESSIKIVSEFFDKIIKAIDSSDFVDKVTNVTNSMLKLSSAFQVLPTINEKVLSDKLGKLLSFTSVLNKPINGGATIDEFPVVDLINNLKDRVREVSDGLDEVNKLITGIQRKNMGDSLNSLTTSLNKLHKDVGTILNKEDQNAKVTLDKMSSNLAAKTRLNVDTAPIQQHITIEVSMKTSDIEEMIFKDAKSITLRGLNTVWNKKEGETSNNLYYSPGSRSVVPVPGAASSK